MKTKYSVRFTLPVTLLLGSALFFTSCTKEAPVSPKEVTTDNVLHVLAQADASNYVTMKTASTWMASGGSIVTQAQQIIFLARTVAGNKSMLHMELYCASLVNGVYQTPEYLYSAWGNYDEVALATAAAPGKKFYLKLSHVSGWFGWPVTMELGVAYLITIPGTSVKVTIGMYPA